MIPATPYIEAAIDAIPRNDAPEVAERGSQIRRDYLNLQELLRRALALAKLIERKTNGNV